MGSRGLFDKLVGKVVRLEGGHSMNPDDPGNWTGGQIGKGILKGTKYGISAAAYPELDIANLTKEQAGNIYFRDYWLAAGCETVSPPLGFLTFDSAVQHGVGKAREFLDRSGGDIWLFLSLRLYYYSNLRQFFQDDGNPTNDFGRGWVRRMAAVAAEVSRLAEDDEASSWQIIVEMPGRNRTVVPIPHDHHVVERVAPDRRRVYLTVKERPDV